MFIGHFAPALIAAAQPRGLRLGPLVLAAHLVDLALWALVLLGVEHVSLTPGLTVTSPLDLWDARWTHSLLGTLGWAAGFTVAAKLLTRDARAAWIGGAVVAVHWPLDLIVHTRDLTLFGVGERHGWGLWDHPYLAMPGELLLAFVAFAFFLERTRALDWRGRVMPWVLGVVATGFQLAVWLAPQPAEPVFAVPRALPVSALAAYVILIVLAWWTGATRVPRERAE